jgi:hypothetical protein
MSIFYFVMEYVDGVNLRALKPTQATRVETSREIGDGGHFHPFDWASKPALPRRR